MKIKLIPADRSQLKELITFAFEGDNDLLDKYHISPGSLEHCVNHTFTFIDKNKDFYQSDMHIFSVGIQIDEEYKTIGYTITITNETNPHELYSFGIRKEYRIKEIKEAWLIAIDEVIPPPYSIVLWSVNTRAIDFFRRNGFYVEERNELKRLTNGKMGDKETLIVKT